MLILLDAHGTLARAGGAIAATGMIRPTDPPLRYTTTSRATEPTAKRRPNLILLANAGAMAATAACVMCDVSRAVIHTRDYQLHAPYAAEHKHEPCEPTIP